MTSHRRLNPTNMSNTESPLPTPITNSDDSDDDELLHDYPPFVRVHKSGRVERLLGTSTVSAGYDPATGVSSKDVTLFPGVSARLFLPLQATNTTNNNDTNSKKKKKLPVLIYYHGGGFVIESASSPTYVTFLNALCSAAGVLAVSVDYRRAPEHPLPAAYDDSYAALQWALSPDGSDPWLAEHGDPGAVLLGGDSAGANIVHYVLLRRAASAAGPLLGAVLIHPFFWGTTDVGPRSAEAQKQGLVEKLWRFVCPATSGVDDPRMNPLAAALGGMGCGRVLVCVAEKDILMEWGWAYYKGLASTSGLEARVKMLETKGEDHVFHLMKPNSDEAQDFVRRLADFIQQLAPPS